uniref:EF-hand domain-containing protein n=1 Tax=Oncorhynchus tshawytscha TaxID=74940 RepID=A0A8C8M5R4_ONCTS
LVVPGLVAHHDPNRPGRGAKSRGGAVPMRKSSDRRGSDWGSIAMLDKTKEFFQTCDVEGKGFITRTDMRRLHRELPLTAEELDNVFDSLNTDQNGYLTLEVFSSGFSQFLHSRRISVAEDAAPALPTSRKPSEALYQSQWDERLTGGWEDEEESHFCMLLESLGASNVFQDPGEVRSLWAQLRRDEPHLLSNFEEFLARVTFQIKEAKEERREMESALQRKAATHDSEIRGLYEEMEQQMKSEKDRLLLQDSERLQSRSHNLEHQLSSKERELEQLFQKQRRLDLQCRDLSSEQQESRVENVKLKMTNEELSRELESTCQELSLAQEQLTMLQDQASRLHQEREMEMYRVTEGLQREKQSLMKQLDLLREMNKHLKDERDIYCAERVKERAVPSPDRLFKVVLVGNSSVGKTSLLRTFCDGRFHPSSPATVGIDYSVKTLMLDNTQVAMQLWDTAGQERYRSITKQFFRKADGVVVMYDITLLDSFKAVRPWLINVQEAAGVGIPILLLGNKMDATSEREVPLKDAETLAHDTRVIFYEVSAYTGYNVTERDSP